MNKQQNHPLQRKHRPRVKVGIGIGLSDYAAPKPDSNEEDRFSPPYYFQISETYGLESRYGHPELEALLTFHVENGGHSVLSYLVKSIENGARYTHGQQMTIPPHTPFDTPHTVEFRRFEDKRGSYLRAVVLGVEEAYQSLSSQEAHDYLVSQGPLTDPYSL
ncbi:MAG: hypothetical protein IKD06_02455 [Clostridia bacterium]|nr:hypothetical protein [Clostridia bacterium]